VYYLVLGALYLALLQSAIAQSSYSLIGARANGTGYTTSCMDDGWSIFNNTAGLAGVKNVQGGLTYDLMHGFSSFNRIAAFVAAPVKIGTLATGVFRFGDDLYNEQIINLGFANTFGLTSLGGKLQYIQYNAEGFGQRSVLTFSAGGIAKLTPWLSVGAHIINIFQPAITEEENVPTTLVGGISLKASEQINTLIEVEKDIDYKPTLKAGIEYTVHKKFIARSGINLNPQAMFFGFGFRPKHFQFDYAFSYLPDSASRQQVSVCYQLADKK
jgi:hypothetical protein